MLNTLIKKALIAADRWFAGWETQYTMHSLQRMVEEAGFEVVHCYGDWMRPNLIYRIIREIAKKAGIKTYYFYLRKSLVQNAIQRRSNIPHIAGDKNFHSLSNFFFRAVATIVPSRTTQL